MDFSDITSREEAERRVQDGSLRPILLFPEELGGEDVDVNRVYVPSAVQPVVQQIVDTVIRYAQDGLVNRLVVTPDYKDSSVVPARLRYAATHEEKDGAFNPVIEIW